MYICYRNVDTEWICMCYWTTILIKANSLDLRTDIWKVKYKNLHASEQSHSLIPGAMIQLRTFVPSGRYLIGMEYERRLKLFSLLYLKNRYSLKNCAEDLLESLQCYWVSSDFLEDDILYDRQQVRLDKIWPEFIEDLYDGRFYFYISWFKPCICHGTW